MSRKVSVILGPHAFRIVSGSDHAEDRPRYEKTLGVFNSVLSDATIYYAGHTKYLCPDRLEGGFVLKRDSYTNRDFFTTTYDPDFRPFVIRKGRKVSVEWTGV